MNKVCVLTTIFPMRYDYVERFFESLSHQTYSSFDTVIVNDGFGDISNIKSKNNNLNILEVEADSTPSKNRQVAIEFAIKSGYEIAILCDSDDYMDIHRVDVCVEQLKSTDIVVNELELFSEIGTIHDEYLSKRFLDGDIIEISDIKDKNIIGLSNSAFKLSIIDQFDFPKELIAIDWFLFSILILSGAKAKFTNKTKTYYRQYDQNTVGLGYMNEKKLIRCLDIKLLHYKLLKEYDFEYSKLLDEVIIIRDALVNEKFKSDYISQCNEKIKFPLWWELIPIKEVFNETNK
ncbi:glycosyltransferase family A protein [Vibrio aquimaris]|uniref:Glycosyl transferase family 2 n=1 Tax=Vibrio aquimaris TaxID=2587862 RepID=A0A5P9CF70_9VIBR|nr:glycosyltransferase family A protein [Vibrio aquimaris]QFT24854.1 Glycosyl transferase family 2 [Vibrio aquimaris]